MEKKRVADMNMDMKDYKNILKQISEERGEDTVNKLKKNAESKYASFQYAIKQAQNKTAKMHITFIAERCAMYLALKEFDPEHAYELMNQAIYEKCVPQRKMFDRLTRIPGMKYVFIKICGIMTRNVFGEQSGFKQHIIKDDKSTFAFDMLQCPYCKFCKEFGCEELIKTFCDSDEYAYKGLKNIEFIRTTTLGTGGNCCNFCYRVRKS